MSVLLISSSTCVKYIVNMSGSTCTISSSVNMSINGTGCTVVLHFSLFKWKNVTCINIGGAWLLFILMFKTLT